MKLFLTVFYYAHRSLIQQLMGADAENHSHTLGGTRGIPLKREGKTLRARGVQDTPRTWPTQSNKKGL